MIVNALMVHDPGHREGSHWEEGVRTIFDRHDGAAPDRSEIPRGRNTANAAHAAPSSRP